MKIIKQYCPYAKTAVVRTNTYGKTLTHILMLFEEAKKDFPKLVEDAVVVVKYGGRHIKGIYGIEFKASKKSVPEYYDELRELEDVS